MSNGPHCPVRVGRMARPCWKAAVLPLRLSGAPLDVMATCRRHGEMLERAARATGVRT